MSREVRRLDAPQHPASDPSDGNGDDLLSRTWLRALLMMVAALALAAAVALAIVHVDDRYGLDHVSGARMALARSFNHGTLYPELFDGTFYGGTRWMPLPTVIHGFAARITGEYLVSGKLVSYGAMAALILVSLWVMRRLQTPLPLALPLAAMVLVTRVGLMTSTDLRFDALALTLQLLAISIAARGSRPRAMVGAAALATLALLSKVSAVWAPVVIVVWLLVRRRHLVLWFLLPYVGFVGAALLGFMTVTDGGIIENVFGLGSSGIDLRSLVVAPYRFVDLLITHAAPVWALLPAAGFAGWLALRRRQMSIYLLALLSSILVAVFVLGDIGTGWNQLLDVIVLSAIVVGEMGAKLASEEFFDRSFRAALGTLLALTVLWLGAGGAAATLLPDVREALSDGAVFRPSPLEGYASSGSTVLSEDPYVPISLGQRPVVLDPFMLLRIGQRDPSTVAPLIERIEAQRFDLVVLVVPLRPIEQDWWSEYHFGIDVMRAIARSYGPVGKVQGYYLYAPRDGAPAG